MRALIVTPAPEGSLSGNRHTALRWAEILGRLEHTPQIVEEYRGQACDLMIALHAAKSADSIARFRGERPDTPLLVALTGTDLYRDLPHSEAARQSLGLATRLIALQPLASKELVEALRGRLRVIYQSAQPVSGAPAPSEDHFEICVLGHLRPVKDPFRCAEAVNLLADDSRALVVHVGSALEPAMEERALREQSTNPRYRWLGPLPRDEALRVLARARLLVLSSFMEGGANVIGEAAVHGVPVIASRIPGSVGLLGTDYPGYYPAGDTEALAAQIRRSETDTTFLDDLRSRCASLAAVFDPQAECESWKRLLSELFAA